MYKKAHLVSDFRKKNLLGWSSNQRNETKSESLHERVLVSVLPELSNSHKIYLTNSFITAIWGSLALCKFHLYKKQIIDS